MPVLPSPGQAPLVVFQDIGAFADMVETYHNKVITLHVYSSVTEQIRQVRICPRLNWGVAEGLLGCDVVQGYIHRAPPRRKLVAPEDLDKVDLLPSQIKVQGALNLENFGDDELKTEQNSNHNYRVASDTIEEHPNEKADELDDDEDSHSSGSSSSSRHSYNELKQQFENEIKMMKDKKYESCHEKSLLNDLKKQSSEEDTTISGDDGLTQINSKQGEEKNLSRAEQGIQMVYQYEATDAGSSLRYPTTHITLPTELHPGPIRTEEKIRTEYHSKNVNPK